MDTKLKFAILLLILFVVFLAGCDTGLKFDAPEIDPPTDLVPGYIPEGFKLISGFQIPGDMTLYKFALGDIGGLVGRLKAGDHFFNLKSPAGNIVQGLYYKSKQNLILVTKSYFAEGNLDDWLAVYEKGQPKPCDCDCAGLVRLDIMPFPIRFEELQEERTIDGTRVAILTGPLGWTTVFVRGDYLLTVESAISLEENLKIVASLLNN
jgi:hypothetical protein